MSRLNRPSHPLLCYVTDRSALSLSPSTAALLDRIGQACGVGIDWIQIREKDLSGREIATLARSALAQASQTRQGSSTSKIIVNDRLDVALAESASGAHFGERGLPVADARKLVVAAHRSSEAPFLLGVSCHSLDAAQAAALSGADYLFFGPVFATPSKSAFGTPQGLARFSEVCKAVSIPVLAIGGIDQHSAADCLSAGAAGIAAIRLFQDAVDLPALVQTLHELPLR